MEGFVNLEVYTAHRNAGDHTCTTAVLEELNTWKDLEKIQPFYKTSTGYSWPH